ncbi:MAG TPA: glycosyltransferase family 2 protein [Clostridia bacterium]|nr:glycosyltransferase family 2 protein [Clostridia bacterium]
MQVSVITVTYNSAACIRECLKSAATQQGIDAEIILVDNASRDNTVEIARGFGGRVTVLANQQNVGFGIGCNQGFEISRGQFIYLLNPDAQLVTPNALSKLCAELGRHPQWGMAGNRILSADGELKDPPAIHYPNQGRVRADFSELPGEIAWVLGASMIIRRDVYTEVGGFDPSFFLYGEEIDFCLRVRQHGHEIGYVDDVEVEHIGGASERGSDPYDVAARRISGLHRFWQKHYAPDDVAYLIRRDQLRSGYRMAVYWMLSCGHAHDGKAWRKHRRYRAIWEVSSKFLAHHRERGTNYNA